VNSQYYQLIKPLGKQKGIIWVYARRDDKGIHITVLSLLGGCTQFHKQKCPFVIFHSAVLQPLKSNSKQMAVLTTRKRKV
jgi:hypothetical protein